MKRATPSLSAHGTVRRRPRVLAGGGQATCVCSSRDLFLLIEARIDGLIQVDGVLSWYVCERLKSTLFRETRGASGGDCGCSRGKATGRAKPDTLPERGGQVASETNPSSRRSRFPLGTTGDRHDTWRLPSLGGEASPHAR